MAHRRLSSELVSIRHERATHGVNLDVDRLTSVGPLTAWRATGGEELGLNPGESTECRSAPRPCSRRELGSYSSAAAASPTRVILRARTSWPFARVPARLVPARHASWNAPGGNGRSSRHRLREE